MVVRGWIPANNFALLVPFNKTERCLFDKAGDLLAGGDNLLGALIGFEHTAGGLDQARGGNCPRLGLSG